VWRSSTDPALTFPPPKDRRIEARGWLLTKGGHPSDIYYSDRAAAEIDELISEFAPHIIVIERLWLHRYIEHVKGHKCRVVLDNHNIEADLYRQLANCVEGDDLQAGLFGKILPERTEMIEGRAIKAADQVWVCSGEDKRTLRSLYGTMPHVRVIPNGLNLDYYAEVRKEKTLRPQAIDPCQQPIIFLAMFGYHPNSRAANFLIEEVYPELIAINDRCQLLFVGAMPTEQMLNAEKYYPRLSVTGQVPDVRPYLTASSIMVVPLFEASGTRYKILEAFAAKVPVISTVKGAQGLAVENGEHLMIAETPKEFRDAIKQLWMDECLVKRLTDKALRLVTQQYSWHAVSLKIKEATYELTQQA